MPRLADHLVGRSQTRGVYAGLGDQPSTPASAAATRLRRVKPAIGGIRMRSRDRTHLVERAHAANRRAVETEERLATILEHLPAAVYLDRYQRSDGAFMEVVYSSPHWSS